VYAVIRSGGKQYRVAPGDTVRLERFEGPVGSQVTFTGDDVLAVRTEESVVTGKAASAAKVTGRIVEQGRNPKLLVMKYKKTNQYRITRGHRQGYTAVRVSDIKLD